MAHTVYGNMEHIKVSTSKLVGMIKLCVLTLMNDMMLKYKKINISFQ